MGKYVSIKKYIIFIIFGAILEIIVFLVWLCTKNNINGRLKILRDDISKAVVVIGIVLIALNIYLIINANKINKLSKNLEYNFCYKDELKDYHNLVLFIDEIHTLMGTKGEALDFANMFKPGLDRGDIKVIGATTTEEYEQYILRDKAFVRRFQRVEVKEPTREETIAICLGTLPKIEKKTGATLMYDPYVKEKIMAFLTDLTSEYRRVYETGARYPDVTLAILQQSFSFALYDNRKEVNIFDVKKAILNTKNVYQDVIKKEIPRFEKEFKQEIEDGIDRGLSNDK